MIAIVLSSLLAAPPPPAEAEGGLTLGRAVEIALERNFTILTEADTLKGARVRDTVARAQFYPKVMPSYQRFTDDSAFALEASQKLPWTGGTLSSAAAFHTFGASETTPASGSQWRFALSQPLLRGFGPNATSFERTNSRRAVKAQERSFELARQRLAIDVARAFYDVLQQRQLLAVSDQSLKRSEGLVQASEARLKVGLVSKLDVFRAQLQAAQAREAMVRSQAALDTALERFRFLLGFAPADGVAPSDVALPEPGERLLEPVEALVSRALASRLDLQETRDQEDDARRSASLARQNLLPQLDFNVAVSRFSFGSPLVPSLTPATDRRVNVFLTASYPLERSADRANKAVADLEQTARARSRRQREIEVETEVRAAVRELERIRKSVDLQRQAVDIAEQQQRLAMLRYQRGLASNFDVVDAEGSLVQARSALVTLLASHEIARFELLRLTGELDEERDFRP